MRTGGRYGANRVTLNDTTRAVFAREIAQFERGLGGRLWLASSQGHRHEATRNARRAAAAWARHFVDSTWGRDDTPMMTYQWADAVEQHARARDGVHVFYLTKYHTVVNMSNLPDLEAYAIPIDEILPGFDISPRGEAFRRYRDQKMDLWRHGVMVEGLARLRYRDIN